MKTSSENLEWVERLAQTMVEHKLHKLEFETENVSLTLRSKKVQPKPPQPAPVSHTVGETRDDVEEADVILVRSKDVGLFRPGKDLKAGVTVTRGQKLGSIEAVSVEHDLLSEYDGTLLEMVVQDGDPVEYGQPLLVLSESEG